MEGTPPVPLNLPGLFQEGKRVDAIILSHSHLDHTGLLPKTHPEIPVYLSIGADKALFILRTFTRENLLRGRKLEKLIPGCMVQFGDIGVTPFEVDHSAPGCLAFLVESKGSTIVYSGDLRLHGRNQQCFETLKTGLRGKTINALLMEGTTLSTGRGKGLTELELEEKIHEEILKAPGLVFALFSPLHLSTGENGT
jgi:ribonuclease J